MQARRIGNSRFDEHFRAKTASTSHEDCSGSAKTLSLKHATVTFHRAMALIFSSVKWRSALLYLDDMAFFSRRNLNDHTASVLPVVRLLEHAVITFILQRCSVFFKNISYLGHFIRLRRLALWEATTADICKLIYLTAHIALRYFFGVCSDLSRLITNLSEVAVPLNKKLQSD